MALLRAGPGQCARLRRINGNIRRDGDVVLHRGCPRTVALALVDSYSWVGHSGWHMREAHILGAIRTNSILEWVGYQFEAGMMTGAFGEAQSDRWSDLGPGSLMVLSAG